MRLYRQSEILCKVYPGAASTMRIRCPHRQNAGLLALSVFLSKSQMEPVFKQLL